MGRKTTPHKRPTIRDIARMADVSPGAVSLALNNKPGVSDDTRRRIVEIAQSTGWTASAAARALSSSKALALGLVLARPRASMEAERFYFQFICGLEAVLTTRGHSLVLQMVDDIGEEMEVHRAWWSQRRVDSVVLVDPRQEDPRPSALARLGLPFATVGTHFSGGGAVLIDDAAMIATALNHLAEQGYRRVAYVCGLGNLQHTLRRQIAFSRHGAQLGLDTQLSNPTDYSEDSGVAETRHLLGARKLPDAIIYDNEILTLGGLAALAGEGVAVPKEVALMSLEDSPICRVMDPQISAFRRDPARLGEAVAEVSLSEDAQVRELPAPELAVRASTKSD